MPDRAATTDRPILDVLTERWSTRLFDGETPIDEDALASALEAARWSPSASNTQPWRFLVARRGTASHAKIVDALVGFNQGWAPDAAALVVFVAATEADGKPLRWSSYDVGQAAAHFTVQAHAAGLFTHQMGGFDAGALAASFSLPDNLRPLTVTAVGSLGDFASASEKVQERESAPRTRRPVAESLLLDD
ncbi:MAG TPA: nitroreductase [Microbacterium sp.]|nr:nitroreductase [Microbacterium sp.]